MDKPIELIFNKDAPFALSEVKIHGQATNPSSFDITVAADGRQYLTLVYSWNRVDFRLHTEGE